MTDHTVSLIYKKDFPFVISLDMGELDAYYVGLYENWIRIWINGHCEKRYYIETNYEKSESFLTFYFESSVDAVLFRLILDRFKRPVAKQEIHEFMTLNLHDILIKNQ